MINNTKLINCNLSEICEPFCAVIENVQIFEQEINELCSKESISPTRNNQVSVRVNKLKEKLKLNEDKIKLVKQIINARNRLVHTFFVNPMDCMEKIKIDDIKTGQDFLKNLEMINKLAFEMRDYFGNIYDNGNRPNLIDGTYSPLE